MVNRLHEGTSQQIHGQVQEGHKICQKHAYTEAKDASAASFDGGMFVPLQHTFLNFEFYYFIPEMLTH